MIMQDRTGGFDIDLMSLEEPLHRGEARPDPNDNGVRCKFCGSDNLIDNDKEITCADCCIVQEKVIEFKDRIAFDEQQKASRSTQSPTSMMSPDKNLGSRIGATAKDIKNPMIRKIVIAERRHVNGNDERELKEVIHIVTRIADASSLNLCRKEVEDLIITYRKRFLGTKLAIGRSRYAVILAFVFLELRESSHRQYLSIAEFLKIVGKGSDGELKREFISAVSHMQKEHGYKLIQPTVDVIITSIVLKLGLAPIVARDANKVVKIISKDYKMRGVKTSGIAGAVVAISCKANKIPMLFSELVEIIDDVKSQMTIQNRIREIYEMLSIARSAAMSSITMITDPKKKAAVCRMIEFIGRMSA